jgi:hypothetical protein
MNPWFFPWQELLNASLLNSPFFKFPLSGNVTQDINPVTSWLSPQLEFNFAGNHQIEADVISTVASYGKQLGTISEAVLELADGTQNGAIEQLRQLTKDIDSIKKKHQQQEATRLKAGLEQLQKNDPDAFKQLLLSFQ